MPNSVILQNIMEFSRINIYRMTHIENIPHILKFGITNKNSVNRNPNYIDIGDTQIINTRHHKEVNVTNGTKDFSYRWINLGDYIPFYFGVRMPMLYVSQQGGNFVKEATKNENIVYLVCNVQKIKDAGGFTFYFSDGHAVTKFTQFYDENYVEKLPAILDYDAIKSLKWDGLENLDRKRKKQAEFLILEDIPVDFIIGLACYNEAAKIKLVEMGIDSNIIKVCRNCYF